MLAALGRSDHRVPEETGRLQRTRALDAVLLEDSLLEVLNEAFWRAVEALGVV